MTNYVAKLSSLLEARKKLLPLLSINARARDAKGSSTNLLGLSHRFIGVAEYLVNGDVDTFRRELAASARCRLDLINRFEGGGDVSHSYVALTGGYKALLDALAAGNTELALELAPRIGGRESIEKDYDHPFDRAFGYALKSAALKSSDLELKLSELSKQIGKQENQNYQGYLDALLVLCSNRHEDLSAILVRIVEGHIRQVKRGSDFKGTEDEWLCVWGVGVANLLIGQGYSVNFNHALIPKPLLDDTQEFRGQCNRPN